MSVRGRKFLGCSLFAAAALFSSGCEALQDASAWAFANSADYADEEEKYREQFQVERDPQALDWLLANRIRQGMSLAAVRKTLGDPGARELQGRHIKTGNPNLLQSDELHKWGPDSSSRVFILAFRDGRLVDYDAHSMKSEDPFKE